LGVKSITIVQETAMMLFLPRSRVVTSTTGPGSINVKARLSFIALMPDPLSTVIDPPLRLSDLRRRQDQASMITFNAPVSDARLNVS